MEIFTPPPHQQVPPLSKAPCGTWSPSALVTRLSLALSVSSLLLSPFLPVSPYGNWGVSAELCRPAARPAQAREITGNKQKRRRKRKNQGRKAKRNTGEDDEVFPHLMRISVCNFFFICVSCLFPKRIAFPFLSLLGIYNYVMACVISH